MLLMNKSDSAGIFIPMTNHFGVFFLFSEPPNHFEAYASFLKKDEKASSPESYVIQK